MRRRQVWDGVYTHVRAANSFQKQFGNFSLAVKLGLRNSQICLRLEMVFKFLFTMCIN